MVRRFLALVAVLTVASAAGPVPGRAWAATAPAGAPDVAHDLGSEAGAAAVQATWKWAPATVVEIPFRDAGPDRKPSGPANRTYDFAPHAEAAGFDDRAWATIPPTSLAERRGTGKVSFGWYRLTLTLPEKLGDTPVRGATVAFETVVDDYAEIWVDGRLERQLGQAGGAVVAGFNTANRVVLTEDAVPGRPIEVAIFAANGPLSLAPENYIWIRYARLDVYGRTRGQEPEPVAAQITRLDPAFDAIVPRDARLERIGSGFQFTEGPVWVDGGLTFSDPNANTIYRRGPDGRVRVFRANSGYAGADVAAYRQPGSNGLTLDREGRLTIAQHGNRRIVRLEKDGTETVLADRYEGKRLNSPNDLVYRSDGALFFTDPPFGLPKVYDDPGKELPYSGVYALLGGRLRLLTRELVGPNGLAFSPDEKFLYVGNWDPKRKVVLRYEVAADGALTGGTVFADLGDVPGEEAIDGVKVDKIGNVYVSGPGGTWIYSGGGTRLGAIRGPELAANLAWGDADAKGLYLAARTGLYRIRLAVPGIRPAASAAPPASGLAGMALEGAGR